jgi:hypothetical protein
MQRRASLIAGMLGVWLSLLAAIPAEAGPTGCIHVFRPIRWSYSCPTPTGCGSPCYCGFGEYCYDYPYQVLDCATGEPTNSCGSAAENEAYEAWLDANRPMGRAMDAPLTFDRSDPVEQLEQEDHDRDHDVCDDRANRGHVTRGDPSCQTQWPAEQA